MGFLVRLWNHFSELQHKYFILLLGFGTFSSLHKFAEEVVTVLCLVLYMVGLKFFCRISMQSSPPHVVIDSPSERAARVGCLPLLPNPYT